MYTIFVYENKEMMIWHKLSNSCHNVNLASSKLRGENGENHFIISHLSLSWKA